MTGRMRRLRERARLVREITSEAEMELRHFGDDGPASQEILARRVRDRLSRRYDEAGSVWPLILQLLPIILQLILELSKDAAAAGQPAAETVVDDSEAPADDEG